MNEFKMELNCTKKVQIIIGKCIKTGQLFGMRAEEFSPEIWSVTWAFPIKDKIAKNEGYDNTKISGFFNFTDTYPGCPHCGAKGSVLCRCGKTTCFDNDTTIGKCAWCNNQFNVAYNRLTMDVGSDR